MVWCGFGLFLASRCGLAKIIYAPHLIFAFTYAVQCGVVWRGLDFSQNCNRTAPHLIFVVTCVIWCIRCSLNSLKLIYFSNFGFFPPSPKLIFHFVLGQILNYWISFSLFWDGFPSQHLLGYQTFFFLYFKN